MSAFRRIKPLQGAQKGAQSLTPEQLHLRTLERRARAHRIREQNLRSRGRL